MPVSVVFVSVAAAAAMTSFSSGVAATDLWMYVDDNYSKHSTFKHFGFGTTQRCYTIKHCFDNKASSASWTNVPDHSSIVFYADENCEGASVSSPSTPSGQTKFAWWGLDKQISSVIIHQSSVFPTAGIVQECHESATLVSGNDSLSSFDGSNEADVGEYVVVNGSTSR